MGPEKVHNNCHPDKKINCTHSFFYNILLGFISFVIALFKGKINKAPKLKEVTHDQFKSDAPMLAYLYILV